MATAKAAADSPEPAAVAEETPTAAEPRELANAGAATDPAVHQLAAERHSHLMNGDAERAAAVTAQLAELGYK